MLNARVSHTILSSVVALIAIAPVAGKTNPIVRSATAA
jgi:hypothetical protein